MNKILYLKVKKDFTLPLTKSVSILGNINTGFTVVTKDEFNNLQDGSMKFDLKDNANVFDIEQKINDKEYSEFIKNNS